MAMLPKLLGGSMNKFSTALFSVILFLFAVTANAQKIVTHQVTMDGVTLFEAHDSWKSGGVEYTEVCSKKLGCVTGTETSDLVILNLSGVKYEIRKANFAGTRVYHEIPNKTINWNLFENGRIVGTMSVSFLGYSAEGWRNYREAISLGSVQGSGMSSVSGMTLMRHDGQINGMQFSVRKL